MKTLPQTIMGWVLGAGLGFLLPALAVAQEGSGKVELNHNPKTGEFNGLVIHPGAKFSKEDEAKVNAVLQKYDKRQYRIEHHKNGKLISDGKLVDQEKNKKGLTYVYIDRSIKSDVANAKAAGITDWTWVFEVGKNDQGMPLENLAKGKEMNKQLLGELKPILDKYTKH